MRSSKKSVWMLSLLLLLSLVLIAACSNNDGGSSEAPETNAPDDSATGEDDVVEETTGGDLIIATKSEIVGLDPHTSNDVPSSNIAYNIYESLVYFDENDELQPLLAESWDQIDELTLEFTLKQGVKFHDDTDFNAEVVKANIERILDPATASQRLFLYEMVTEVNVIDEYTVQIVTEYPFAPLLPHLAHSAGGMISLDAIEKDREAVASGQNPGSHISSNPVGTGYFKFDYWTTGEEVKLVRNDNYWGEHAKVDSVTFKVVGEELTRLTELETGYVHIAEQMQPSDITRIQGLPNAGLNETPQTSLSYIAFNTQKEPFTDVRVRQAISMAIDPAQIIDGILYGAGIPAVGPLAQSVLGYDASVTPLEYDIEGAKALLAEAGYADGFSTTIWTNDSATRVQTAEYLQSALRELNIDVSVEIVEWATYLEDTSAGKHDMFILGWSTPTSDADYAMYALFHSKNHGSTGNRTFLTDAELDDLLDRGRQEVDPDARLAIYKEAQERLVEIAPMVYTHYTILLTGISDSVHDFWVTPNGIFRLQNVYISE
ncbi:glutathione ABC transporter substrate-binding protein [Bacillus horti]|uniref:Peptide/nickel transport system substrate-binding protein n=1 Tax=Caldalkalibacillus horti TaxID=77523 RepID=A0ABT9W312_9BACI|nr:glutathione ABC transporter substrate-binding protein [Bacillus horti]MDQ0167632.1 peptide/nickel transport system substrate-binding protein [Bacillus horti]